MVRDLDKLRTRSEFRLRTGHLALIVLATAVAVGLLFLVGNAVAGSSDGGPPAPAPDPFAALQPAAALPPPAPPPAPAARQPSAPSAVPDPDALPPLVLTFHERLSRPDGEVRPPFPAVADSALAGPPLDEDAPLPVETPAAVQPPPPLPGPPSATPAPATSPGAATVPAPTIAPAVPPAIPPGLPIAPPPVQSTREPSAPPLPPGDPQPRFDEEPNPPLAQPGERGVFTLQVASFTIQDEAIAYMNMLRQRGHESFIVRADCGERGLVYRVRVGPFDSQAEAERYRRKFERTERIPTFVVRRTRPEPERLPGTL